MVRCTVRTLQVKFSCLWTLGAVIFPADTHFSTLRRVRSSNFFLASTFFGSFKLLGVLDYFVDGLKERFTAVEISRNDMLASLKETIVDLSFLVNSDAPPI